MQISAPQISSTKMKRLSSRYGENEQLIAAALTVWDFAVSSQQVPTDYIPNVETLWSLCFKLKHWCVSPETSHCGHHAPPSQIIPSQVDSRAHERKCRWRLLSGGKECCWTRVREAYVAKLGKFYAESTPVKGCEDDGVGDDPYQECLPICALLEAHDGPTFDSPTDLQSSLNDLASMISLMVSSCQLPDTPLSHEGTPRSTPRAQYASQALASHVVLATNCTDNVAFLRAANTPQRGLHGAALFALLQASHARGLSLYQTAMSFVRQSKLGGMSYRHTMPHGLAPYFVYLQDLVECVEAIQEVLMECKDPHTAVPRAIFTAKKMAIRTAHSSRRDQLCTSCNTPRALRRHVQPCTCISEGDIRQATELLKAEWDRYHSSCNQSDDLPSDSATATSSEALSLFLSHLSTHATPLLPTWNPPRSRNSPTPNKSPPETETDPSLSPSLLSPIHQENRAHLRDKESPQTLPKPVENSKFKRGRNPLSPTKHQENNSKERATRPNRKDLRLSTESVCGVAQTLVFGDVCGEAGKENVQEPTLQNDSDDSKPIKTLETIKNPANCKKAGAGSKVKPVKLVPGQKTMDVFFSKVR